MEGRSDGRHERCLLTRLGNSLGHSLLSLTPVMWIVLQCQREAAVNGQLCVILEENSISHRTIERRRATPAASRNRKKCTAAAVAVTGGPRPPRLYLRG